MDGGRVPSFDRGAPTQQPGEERSEHGDIPADVHLGDEVASPVARGLEGERSARPKEGVGEHALVAQEPLLPNLGDAGPGPQPEAADPLVEEVHRTDGDRRTLYGAELDVLGVPVQVVCFEVGEEGPHPFGRGGDVAVVGNTDHASGPRRGPPVSSL